MAAVFGQGTLLEKDIGTDNWVTVAQCKTISGPSYEASEVDVTTHDSTAGFREFIRGLVDPGEITAEVVFDPSDATHAEVTGVIADLKTGVIRPWRIKWVPATPTREVEFLAFVKSFPITSPVDAELSATVTLRVTGDITLQNSV